MLILNSSHRTTERPKQISLKSITFTCNLHDKVYTSHRYTWCMYMFKLSKRPLLATQGLARICSKLLMLHRIHGLRISTSLLSLRVKSATVLQSKISVAWQTVKRPNGGHVFTAEGAAIRPASPTCEAGTRTRTSLLAALIRVLVDFVVEEPIVFQRFIILYCVQTSSGRTLYAPADWNTKCTSRLVKIFWLSFHICL